MNVILDINSDNPDGAKHMTITPTENYNFVSIEVDGHYYDILIEELYRSMIPFMEARAEERRYNE